MTTLRLIIFFSLAAVLQAQEPGWEIATAEGVSWTSILLNERTNDERGTQEFLQLDDKLLFCPVVTIKPNWNTRFAPIRVAGKEVKFVGEDGVTYPVAGTLGDDLILNGMAEMRQSGQKVQGKQMPESFVFRPIFVLPNTVRKGVLQLSYRKVEVDVPEAKGRPNTADAVTVAITDAKLLDRLDSKSGSGKSAIPTVLKNPRGKILAVSFTLQSRTVEYGNFAYPSTAVTLVHDGVTVPTAGLNFSGVIKTTMHNQGANSKAVQTFYFAVPADLKSFRLCFHNEPVTPEFDQIKR